MEKVLFNGRYYNYEIKDNFGLRFEGFIPYNLLVELKKAIFKKNQKQIDNNKTTKERRKQLIQVNRNILDWFSKNKEEVK